MTPRRVRTPVTERGLRKHDHLPAVEAVARAWGDAGAHPGWHERARAAVRDAMPLLARALDRMEDR